MKMAELERVSGIGRSTLHHYLNLGLLPPPDARGPKLHLYGRAHLARLRAIARLRRRGWSLRQIHAQLARPVPPAPPAVPPRRRRRRAGSAGSAAAERERLLDCAARMFSERGYDHVHVADVARAAGVGKATLYQSFTSKAALFVDCLGRLTETARAADPRGLVHAPPEVRRDEAHQAAAMIARFASYRMIVVALGAAVHERDPEVARRAEAAFRRLVTDAEPALRRDMATGRCRRTDPEMLAYMTWGALMAVGARLAHGDRRYTLARALRLYFDFVRHGTAPRAA
jgi:AcrR family transcriptional regulator